MRKSKKNYQIEPDEIFLDDSNLSALDDSQFEGRIEKPIAKMSVYLAGGFFFLIMFALLGRIAYLQVVEGSAYADRSQNNSLRQTVIVPSRGLIYDRNQVELAWNAPDRQYIKLPGFSNLLGYLGYPSDREVNNSTTTFAEKEQVGKAGLEKQFNNLLTGLKGLRVEEVDVHGDIVSENSLQPAVSGQTLNLAIDSRLQTKLFEIITQVVKDRGFAGGSGVIMDVRTGETLALTSYPEYDANIMTSRSDLSAITRFLTDPGKPFLDRVVSGLYTPGSVFKPIVALGALNEGVISPDTSIYSSGQLVIPNPYNPKEKTVFRDWRAHGWVNMYEAIAQSSDEYFYQIGGGYQNQKGLGITNIDKYAQMFGLGQTTGIELPNEEDGVVSSPAWKAANFEDKTWRIGDTYHTAIGQYGTQVTPIQMARVIGTIANGGTLINPTVLKYTGSSTLAAPLGKKLAIAQSYFKVVQTGMRLGVTSPDGTGHGLDVPYVEIASKTGTAELGVSKARVNSWVVGFWPYENPHYVFTVVLESGPRENTIGGVFVMRTLFDWMSVNLREYLN